jgi:uncharacterized protein
MNPRALRRGGPLGLLVLLSIGAQALPTLTAPVTDLAHVIDADSARELDRRIRSLESKTTDAVVVVTVDTFAPYASIEEYAVHLFEHAAIGQKGKDNGVLVVLAVRERRVRIEVGYGIEEFISDGFSGDTIRQEMLPEFRQGRYGAGLLAGTTRVIQRIAAGRGVTLGEVPARKRDAPEVGFVAVIVLLVIFLIVLRVMSRRRGPPGVGRRRWSSGTWSGWHGGVGSFGGGIGGFGGGFGGGGGGGGFGGFGGGRSGGGGASGGW